MQSLDSSFVVATLVQMRSSNQRLSLFSKHMDVFCDIFCDVFRDVFCAVGAEGKSYKSCWKEIVLVVISSPTDVCDLLTLWVHKESTLICIKQLGPTIERVCSFCLLRVLKTSLSKYFLIPPSSVPMMLSRVGDIGLT